MFNYANRIKEIRTLYSVSAYQLAKGLEISQATISKIETGKNLPSIQLLEKICSYFKITLADFFKESDTNDLKSNNLNESTEELVNMYIEKFPDKKDIILSQFKAVEDINVSFRRMILDFLKD